MNKTKRCKREVILDRRGPQSLDIVGPAAERKTKFGDCLLHFLRRDPFTSEAGIWSWERRHSWADEVTFRERKMDAFTAVASLVGQEPADNYAIWEKAVAKNLSNRKSLLHLRGEDCVLDQFCINITSRLTSEWGSTKKKEKRSILGPEKLDFILNLQKYI